MPENPNSPERTDGDFVLPVQLPVEMEALRSQPDRVYSIGAILRTTLTPKGCEKYTRAIGEAFIDRGEAFQAQGKDVEAMQDFSTALQFASTAQWPARRHPRAMDGMERSRTRLREFFMGVQSNPPVRLQPGNLVVAESAVIRSFPHDAGGRQEAIEFVDQVASDKQMQLQLFNEYFVSDDDFLLEVFTFDGLRLPRCVYRQHTGAKAVSQTDVEALSSQPAVNTFERDAQLAAWRKLRWEKKSPTFYMVNIDGRYHLAVLNQSGAWKWRRALIGSPNYTFSPGHFESRQAAQKAAFEALYTLLESDGQE